MPAQAPPISEALQLKLQALGARLRARREALGISAVAAAEAAGMSRTTLHRLESGEPSVTMGAYLGASQALGLLLELRDPEQERRQAELAQAAPEVVRLDRYPQLQRLAWQQPGITELTAREALALYERNWRHVDAAHLEPQERELVNALVKTVGGGRPLV
ncbi:helix-turn-helix domain-containing protein [Pelomonas sp. V22]|uniref:helix-turn-helix domain-containing protein n=1 Tax=Pelomonas sp. V22 TaxID=2822139 RepID=UPI0024A8CF62|nr:helix-turn-helix transcriptional regulator [Pelomonas sp. V22]MDI4633217.1 helix-turn-helix domain-containing protein [Pelomonas sp. V22]